MAKILTRDSFDKLEYSSKMEKIGDFQSANNSVVMFVYKNSDLHSAAHYLAESTKTFNNNKISNILVQESCYEDFIGILKAKLGAFPEELVKNKKFVDSFKKVSAALAVLNAKTIYSEETTNSTRPTIACDISLEHFDEKNSLLIPTLTAFRTIKDALNIAKPLISFTNFCNVWCNGISEAYEIVLNSPFQKFYLNCLNVSLNPIILRKEESCVIVEQNHFYQKIQKDGKDKFVVFPFGTTFAN
ncbi:hypothetical protein ACFFRR_000513 [Megaselia abdita]